MNLENSYLIQTVVVYNSLNNQERLRGYHEIYKSSIPVFTFFHRSPKSSPGTIFYINVPTGVVGDEVKLSIPGRTDYMNIREVEVYGKLSSADSDPDVELPLFPIFLGTEYVFQSGITSVGTTISQFDKNDYVIYPLVNFGPSGSTKSIQFSYNKNNANGRVEVRLGGPSGTLIGIFNPMNTNGCDNYMCTTNLSIDLVDGIHDLTFVGRDQSDVWNLESFELSSSLVFQVITDYRVNYNNGDDIQCTYEVVMTSYNEQMFERYYSNLSSSVEESFFLHLDVDGEKAAREVVENLCRNAQKNVDET